MVSWGCSEKELENRGWAEPLLEKKTHRLMTNLLKSAILKHDPIPGSSILVGQRLKSHHAANRNALIFSFATGP